MDSNGSKNYETMSTQDLRTEARTRPQLVGSWIASATKGALINALTCNDNGVTYTRPERGPQQQTLPTPPVEHDGLTPEARILAALKEMIPANGSASSEELAAIAERVDTLADAQGELQVAVSITSSNIGELSAKVKELADAARPREITVVLPDGQRHDVGVQHKQFDVLLKLVAARVNAFLVGPAGSGKTRAAEGVSEALGLKFYSMSVGPQSTQAQIFGYTDANGRLVRTSFREAYENGGIFLMDEIDAGNAAVITAINQATANMACGFPDGMVRKHPDFVFIAAGNTYGRGADRQYVGRTQLDAATLDRFAVVNWDYDNALERAITSNATWTLRVQTLRENAVKNNVRHVISPRASLFGEKLLSLGMPQADVEEMLIWKGIDKATREKIEGHC